MGNKKTLRDHASELATTLAPHVENARDKAAPVLVDARDKAAPVLADARSKSAPGSPSASDPGSSRPAWLMVGAGAGSTVGEPGSRWVNQVAKIWSNRGMSSGPVQSVARPAQ